MEKKVTLMYELIIAGVVVVLVLVLVIVSKVARAIFKVVALISSLFMVILIILGVFVVKDAFDFKEKVTKQPMAFVIVDNEKVLVSLVVKPNMSEPSVLGKDEVLSISEKKYEPLLKTYYKIWILKPGIVDDFEQDKFQVQGINITKEQVKQALIADKPWEVFGYSNAPGNISSEMIKQGIFGNIMMQEISKNPVILIKEYKKGNIRVIKETPVFMVLKYVPLSIANMVTSKMSGGK